MSSHDKANRVKRHEPATTTRPETPDLEGQAPLPEELTGRASTTNEGVDTLFANNRPDHLADGFRAGNNNDSETDAVTEGDKETEDEEDVTAG